MKFFNSPDYYLLIDADMTIVSFSKNLPEVWQQLYPSTKLKKNVNFGKYLPENVMPFFLKVFKGCLKSENLVIDEKVQFPNGDIYKLHLNLNPVVIENEVPYVMICIKNNTKKREILKKQDENLLKYAHLTSNKLRTPLNDILSLSYNIQNSQAYEPEIIKTLLADITKQAESLDAIIHALNNLMIQEGDRIIIKRQLVQQELKTIVLIDDEPVVNKVHQKLLNTHLPKVHTEIFTNAAEALIYIGQNQTELIILDINMPGINGWQFLDALRERRINSDVIIVTSSIDPDEKRKAFNYENVKHFLIKPLTSEQISRLIGGSEHFQEG